MSNQRYISDTLKKKKKKVIKIKIYLTVFFVILALTGLIFLSRLQSTLISNVQISGTLFVEQSEIEQKTNTILNKNFLWIIPLKNIFLFPKQTLVQSIKENPAVVSVKIKKNFPNTLIIEIVEQEKQVIYCTTPEKTECMYVNKDGFIYAQVKDIIIPEQEILIFNEKENKKIEEQILDQKKYEEIILFVKNLARQEIKIKEIYIRTDSTIDFISRTDTRLVTSMFDEFEKDFRNLVALFEQNILTKDQLSQVEYIDLRFGNKVFYKNKTN